MNKRPRSEAFGVAGATMVAAGSVILSLFLLVTMLQACRSLSSAWSSPAACCSSA